MENNTFNDSVFIDENIPLNIYDPTDTCYSVFNKYFGKKDILLLKSNGREKLKEYADYPSASDITNIIETATNIKSHLYFRMGEPVVIFHLLYKGKIIEMDSSIIYFQNNSIRIENKAYDPVDYTKFNIGDSVTLTGVLVGWKNDSTVNIINCIPN